MTKYVIGVDYGTLSGRAVLVEAATGTELCSSVFDYPHGVIDRTLPTGEPLGHDWALQHPQDYIEVLAHTVPAVLKEAGVNPDQVIGIGTDFTACTILPVTEEGIPLCTMPQYEKNPHAWVKLWKHHAAQDKANELNRIAEEREEPWLKNYGGKISSEWAIPKIWQVLDEAPEIYAAADRFIEAADWIIWQLCGKETRNSCTAGYKEIWNKAAGYPTNEFFKALDPRLEKVVEEKLGTLITPLGEKAGFVTQKAAQLTGLKEGTAVAIGNVDAHVSAPAVGIDGPGKILAIMGTSTCHVLMGTEETQVPGMCGVVADGILPGYYGYEAGQSCVGDHFAWFVDHCLPAGYYDEAQKMGMNVHRYLTEKAQKLKPGESGLLALDWWNGNRSVLVDVDLTGMILGMTLQTKPEEIYRALIEATAYGNREIVENFRRNGVPVEEFFAAGGISQKNPLMMQIYADVLGMPVKISGSDQCPALGSAIFAAVAAGKEAGGYDTVYEAARVMGKIKDTVYQPNPEHAAVYDRLFREYVTLHDYFGRGENDVMKRLKRIKIEQSKA
ncbi:ribulokinase [Anoxybacterium hadale]|uniref:Ribulokinase n=1 Tax=Anoxybacterium hadale TaxID=3408580 RepID=A0ACD1AG48_9FIRM|nr:ribulokinase [Clostridiales bacterium]